MTTKAVIFDLDGTLVDSYPAITASVNHVRNTHGLPPLAEEQVRRHVGRGLTHLLQQCIPVTDLDADTRSYREHHPSVLVAGTRLLPGAAEVLGQLSALGIRLAICSNKPRAFTETLLQFLGIGGHISAVLGPEDVTRPKPAPDMLLVALNRLGVRAAEVVYVGDMTVDIETARGAGVPVWVVTTGSETRSTLAEAEPDRILGSLGEIVALVQAGVGVTTK